MIFTFVFKALIILVSAAFTLASTGGVTRVVAAVRGRVRVLFTAFSVSRTDHPFSIVVTPDRFL